ncbi:MAG: hypothetical protein OEO20_11410 [Gemmatimonadota bacterium]|nr:hypothetical protein [Gemmatimonadota bacterium]MDH3366512.1 hypothetical protein [Gemmatimonadota bacterium]MDH3478901.1 hypothetical protein [Gemmatimonadota bacterium]
MTGKLTVGRTPNFIRKLCAERFHDALPLLDAIIWGGLDLTPEAAERLGLGDPGEPGGPRERAQLVASIKERLSAMELLARVGVGFRTESQADRRGDVGAGVIALPDWDDEVGEYEVIEPGDPAALPRGQAEPGG